MIEALEKRVLLAVDISIDVDQRFQTIDGFGTATNGNLPAEFTTAYQSMFYQDMGSSMLRTTIDFRSLNETHSSDPHIVDLDGPITLGADTNANILLFNFNTPNAKAAGAMAQAGASMKLDQFKLIGTVWTPPGWMKGQERNYWGGYTNPPVYPYWPNDGKDNAGGSLIDNAFNLQQFGRYLAAYVKGFERAYGVPYYAISIQNELAFHEPYSSAVYDPDLYVKAVKAVKAAFAAHNALYPNDPILTKIEGPEDVGVGTPDNPWILWRQFNYISAVRADPAANSAVDIWSNHGYAGWRSPEMWDQYWNGRLPFDHQEAPGAWGTGIKDDGKQSWMTEHSGEDQTWDGALNLAVNLQDALVQSNISAWIYWQMSDETNSPNMFTLTAGTNTTTQKYNAAKHFFRYIRPGAVRVGVNGSDLNGVYVSAYIQDSQHTLTTVLINNQTTAQTITLSAEGSGVSSFNIARRSGPAEVWTSFGPVNFVNGVATFTLPAQSIITLQGTSNPISANAVAGFTSTAPAIDGQVDALWNGRTSYPFANYISGVITNAADLSGSFRLAWDNNKLYMLADVSDDVLVNDSSIPWDDDSVEIYLDGDYSHGSSYDGANDMQIIFGYGDAAPYPGSNTPPSFLNGVTFTSLAVPGGYRIEAAIPWANLGYSTNPLLLNHRFGVDVHVSDDDDGGTRDGKLAWYATTDMSWAIPANFAVGKITADNTPPHASAGGIDFSGGVQRVKVTFDENVFASLQDSDLSLSNLTTPAGTFNGGVQGYDRSTNTATFSLFNTLADGLYRATIPAGSVKDALGNLLAGDYTFYFLVASGSVNSDIYKLQRSADGVSIVVTKNNSTTYSAALSLLSNIAVNPGDGDDTLEIDFANGVPWAAVPFQFDLGNNQSAGDLLRIIGTPSSDSLTVTSTQLTFNTTAIPLTNVESLAFAGGAGNDDLTVNSGSFTFPADASLTTSALAVTVNSSASVIFNATQHIRALTINGGFAQLTSGPKVLVTKSLAITNNGKLDLTNGALIYDYSGASPLATIRSLLISGRNTAGFGNATWTGNGLTSSTAATHLSDEVDLGYAENSALPLGSYSTWMGQTVDQSTILIRYTRGGDADLDGIVNDNDVTILGGLYHDPTAHDWFRADFDYNGTVDDSDVTIVGGLYDPNAPPLV